MAAIRRSASATGDGLSIVNADERRARLRAVVVTRSQVGDAPRWTVPALWPLPTRLAIAAVLAVVYAAVFLGVDPATGVMLKPFNLVHVVVAGLLFGFRGGLAWGSLIALLNVALYQHAGVLGPDVRTFWGNILTALLGVGAGAVVGIVRDLSLTLEREVERRRQAERQKDHLMALIVHDLKNPLTGILGHAELLAQANLSPEEVEVYGETIAGAAEDMSRMVMNILDISRAEDGELRPRYADIDIASLVNDVKAALTRRLGAASQRLEIGPSSDVGRVRADPELMRRALINLVDNALKYTPKARPVRIELAGTREEVEVAVRDEGPGIPPGWEEKVFEKYARLDQGRPAAVDASRGLGLTFCRLVATCHGGKIWVEPNSPTGSVFRLRLPRHAPT